MRPLTSLLKCRREICRTDRQHYRCVKLRGKNDTQLVSAIVGGKEVECFSLLNKPLFPGLSYVLNADGNLVRLFEKCKRKSAHIGLFLLKSVGNEKEGGLFNEAHFKMDVPIGGKPFLKKDIAFIKDVGEVHHCGSVGVIREVLYKGGHPRGETEGRSIPIGKTPHRSSSMDTTEGVTCKDNSNDERERNQRRGPLLDHSQHMHQVVIEIAEKVKIVKWVKGNTAQVDAIKRQMYSQQKDPQIRAYQMEIVDKIKEIIYLNSACSVEYNLLLKYYDVKNVYSLVNLVGSITMGKSSSLQSLLEKEDVEDQLAICLELLNEDIILLKMKKELSTNLKNKFDEEKEKLMIRECISNLKKKIGEKTDHEILSDKFFAKFQSKRSHMGEEASAAILRELNKFSLYSEHCSDYASTYQYLNTVLSIPFGKYAPLCEDISACERTLTKSHYGLHQVKRYILEYVGLYILNKNVKPKILTLVGYPGIGKTSICKSISSALQLPHCIINMNNITSMNELIGHRRTYVNSYEGRIVQALISTDVMNPLIVLDELDKISFTNGNVYSALLNLFDSSQNKGYKDVYVNFPINIGRAFFICTANSVEHIPETLLDRMEVVHVYPYTNEEKVFIFKNYLKKKIQEETKVTDEYLHISEGLLLYVIQNYTNENGLRQFYSIVYSVYKRRAFMLLKGLTGKVHLGVHNLHLFHDYVSFERLQQRGSIAVTPCGHEGMIKSIAFTEDGGQVVTIEVVGLAWGNSHSEGSSNLHCAEVLPKCTTQGEELLLMHPSWSRSQFAMADETMHPQALLRSSQLGKTVTEDACRGGIAAVATSSDMVEPPLIEGGNPPFAMRKAAEGTHRTQPLQRSRSWEPHPNGQIVITGNVGKIMQESILIANTFATQLLKRVAPNFQGQHLHINLSECDVKKDGPSAGVNFVTSILSYHLRTAVSSSVCMTGEITLNGHVLKIGGLVEKMILARNFGIRTLIIPRDNAREYELLPSAVKGNIRVLYVHHYCQIFNFLFPKFGPLPP
ncbi:ATP-dependent protease [Plasmodium vivax Brazil I]|uniref:ATP-dependent protease n=1 Tax=Plasmodium vivax (strain Brazil I) TaxID=1033975 RepID=A0A0J9SPE9_PLAV1|nr:ATP-dependent protease [Plasmodium vivax Brazil I]